tara:strand:+ start:4370 stop:4672 length:303 start_codon:yes stop_codon:yes gene_type:complete
VIKKFGVIFEIFLGGIMWKDEIKKQDYNEDDFFMTEEAVEGKVGEKIQEMYSMAEELSKMQNILSSPDFQRGFPKYSLKEIEKAVKGLGMAVSVMESFPS